MSLYNEFEKLPTKCKEIFFDLMKYETNNTSLGHIISYIADDLECGFFDYCDSPIEKIFLLVMEIYICTHNVHFEINPQCEIQTTKGKYIADFLISFSDYYIATGYYPKNNVEIIVECDGHEFHEKTKEQVKRNNERDLALKKEGYEVLHFSGSQIYNDYAKCVKEVAEYFEIKMGKLKKKRGKKNGNI